MYYLNKKMYTPCRAWTSDRGIHYIRSNLHPPPPTSKLFNNAPETRHCPNTINSDVLTWSGEPGDFKCLTGSSITSDQFCPPPLKKSKFIFAPLKIYIDTLLLPRRPVLGWKALMSGSPAV